MSEEQIQHLRGRPEWPNRIAAAHTVPRELRLPHDRRFDPEQAARVTVPTLLLVGSESPPAYTASAEAVAAVVPDVRVVLLEGQGHGADILAPALFAEHVLEFLRERPLQLYWIRERAERGHPARNVFPRAADGVTHTSTATLRASAPWSSQTLRDCLPLMGVMLSPELNEQILAEAQLSPYGLLDKLQ